MGGNGETIAPHSHEVPISKGFIRLTTLCSYRDTASLTSSLSPTTEIREFRVQSTYVATMNSAIIN